MKRFAKNASILRDGCKHLKAFEEDETAYFRLIKMSNINARVQDRESGRGRYDVLVERAAANYIFEFKVADREKDIEKAAQAALAQIDEKRYGQDLDKTKPLVKIGVGIFGKVCSVRVVMG